jgi:hypothetical protein
MPANPSGTSPRTPQRTRTVENVLNDALEFFARLAAVGFCASLAYLAYGVFSGALRNYPTGFTPALSNQITHNVQIASQTLSVCSVVLALCGVALWWGWQWAAPMFAAAGGILYAGLPFFGVPFLSSASRDILTRQNHPGADALDAFRLSGEILLAAAILLFAGWAWDSLQATLSAPKRAGGRLKVPFYSACWQTHFCKEEISMLCAPGRKGFHKSCWRHRSGCMCDESIADRVMAEARRKMGKDAVKWLGALALPPAPSWTDRFASSHRKAKNQRIACAQCPIYTFHELQKHRILSPIMLVSIPALMVYYAGSVHAWYRAAVDAVDRFSLHLAFDPSRATSAASPIRAALEVSAMEWMVCAVAALALITVGARILEFWCFEAKL